MHIGLFNLMSLRDRSKPPREVYLETVEQVRLAEQMNFDAAWFAEHHFSNYCVCPSPVSMAMYVAPQTKTIRLGPAVVVVPLHHPLRMLEDLAVLDSVSDGRLVIGLGSGYQKYEFHKFGVDLHDSRAIFLETLDVVERYFKGDPLSYDGRFIKIPETSFSVRTIQPRPEVFIAGLLTDSVTQQRVVKAGYTPFFTAGWQRLDELRLLRDKVAAFHSAGSGSGCAPFALQQYLFVTDDLDEARRAAECARYVRRVALSMRNDYARVDGWFLREQPIPDEPSVDEILDRLVIGDAEKCAERLIKEFEQLQPSHVCFFMALPGMPHKSVLRSMERFGSDVLPRIERHFGTLRQIGNSDRQPAVAAG